MKLYIKLLFYTIALFTLSTCKNKLNINAPYKEIPSIYAVLNPQEPIQIIRVNKVFLGEGDANAMAKIADSVNYQPGDLLITMERYKNGVLDSACKNSASKLLTFHDSVLTTNPGAFNTNQRVYVCGDKLFNDGEYRLTVKNVKETSNNTFTAKANAVDVIYQDPFTTYSPPFYPVAAGSPTSSYISYNQASTQTYHIYYRIPNFLTNKLNVINQVKMRIHFYDSISGNPTNTYRYIDYPFTNQLSKNAPKVGNSAVIGRLDLSFKSAELFQAFGISLKQANLPTNIYGRRVYKVEYFIYSSTQEYADYLDYTTPSLSLAQQKPLYSNFDDAKAIGIFTFRSTTTFSKETENGFENDFASNSNTYCYRFFTINGASITPPNLSGCP